MVLRWILEFLSVWTQKSFDFYNVVLKCFVFRCPAVWPPSLGHLPQNSPGMLPLCSCVAVFLWSFLQCFSVFCLRTFKLIFIPMFLSLLFLTNVTQLSFLLMTPAYLNLKNVAEISLNTLITEYVANCIKELVCKDGVVWVMCVLCIFQGIFWFFYINA